MKNDPFVNNLDCNPCGGNGCNVNPCWPSCRNDDERFGRAEWIDQQEKVEIDMDESAKKVLKILVDALNAEENPEDIQNTIYQT